MALEGVIDSTETAPPATPAATPAPPAIPGTPDPATTWAQERAGLVRDLQAERQKRQTFEQQYGATAAALAAEQKRVQALAGLSPKSAEETDAADIQARFAKLFPHLAELSAEDIQALRELKDTSSHLRASADMMWQDKARVMATAVEKKIASELGGDLSKRQIQQIRLAYVDAANDPAFLARHEQGDMSLVDEFASQFINDWFEPARRKVTQQQVQQQRPVPGAKDRSIPGSSGKSIDVTDPKAVEDFLVAGRAARGHGFGRQ